MYYQKDIEKLRWKEFICKPCHKQLKDGKYSNNVQNCGNSDLFGSYLTHEQNDQDTVHRSRTDNERNMICNFPTQYMSPEYNIEKLLPVYMLP